VFLVQIKNHSVLVNWFILISDFVQIKWRNIFESQPFLLMRVCRFDGVEFDLCFVLLSSFWEQWIGIFSNEFLNIFIDWWKTNE